LITSANINIIYFKHFINITSFVYILLAIGYVIVWQYIFSGKENI